MSHFSESTTRSLHAADSGGGVLTLDVRDPADRLFALGEWRTLESRLHDVPLMCSHDWTAAWLDAFGDLVPHWFVLARDRTTEQLVGICLVTRGVDQTDGPLPVRTMHLGTAGEPDADSVCVEYNDVLVDPEWRRPFCEMLRMYFESQRDIDQWNLDGVSEQLATDFACSGERFLCRYETTHWFDLTVPRDKGTRVLDTLRSATRRKIRRSLESVENVTVEWSASLAEAADIFGEMIELHQARWTALGQSGCYASRRFTTFHEALLARLVPQQRMAFVRVRASGETLGCVQLFIDRNRALFYQCGHALDCAASSPGVVVDCLAMEACLDRGFDAYDFLPVATQHKRHLSNRTSVIVWARRRRSRVKFALLDAARSLKHSRFVQHLRISSERTLARLSRRGTG